MESARTRRPSAVPVDGFVRTLDAIRLECWTGSDQNPGRGRIADSPIERFCLSGHREPPGWASSDRNPAGDRLEMPDLIPRHGVDMGTVQGDQIWSRQDEQTWTEALVASWRTSGSSGPHGRPGRSVGHGNHPARRLMPQVFTALHRLVARLRLPARRRGAPAPVRPDIAACPAMLDGVFGPLRDIITKSLRGGRRLIGTFLHAAQSMTAPQLGSSVWPV